MKHCVHASQPLGPFVVLCTHAEAVKFFGERAHVFNCGICGYCRPDPNSTIGLPPLSPAVVASTVSSRPGLGDLVERAVKPIARLIRSDCLDEHDNLKPDSGCAKRRDWLNGVGKS